MRKMLITVNGKVYEVEVEEVASFAPGKPGQSIAQIPPAPATVSEKHELTAPQKGGDPPVSLPQGMKVMAPMPGKIVSVKAGPGQAVKRGDVLMILEAMKMENEIQSPVAGTVTAIAVAEGASVNAGALLACIG
jgi:glutaconyl-CoA/methylmalonyl-CoA decarboxylase subunit gamma